MLLRRLGDGLRAQNWFTVAIELMVLVVGIFLGLQVDDWNQRRIDRNDEQVFLTRLHEELLDSISVRAFLRERRIEHWHRMRDAMEHLANPDEVEGFSDAECNAIYESHIKTSNIADLPSFRTLVATGRLHIVSDEALRSTLVRFNQQRELINQFAELDGFELGPKHPAFFRVQPFINTENDRNDLDIKVACDLDAMRYSQQFKLEFFSNADRYDAYIVSGLMPMEELVQALHALLDENLNITHDKEAVANSKD